jgi:hypothetical protein
MKTITSVFLTAAVALSFIGCGAPANNAPVNTNTNTNTKPVAAAPTVDALMALEKQAHEAYTKGDSAFFETFLSDKFSMAGDKGKPMTKADSVKYIAGVKCEGAKSDFSEPQMSKIDNDTYVVSSKVTWEGTCNDGPGGKTMKIPSPVRSASLYVRNGDKWQGAWHGETLIVEPKGDAKKDEAKTTDTKADAKKEEAKKEEPKKPETKKEDAKKPAADHTASDAPASAAKPADNKASSKMAGNTAASTTAPAAADANTEALVKLHTAGWEAWRQKDAKWFNDNLAATVALVDPMGGWHSSKDEIIKLWTVDDCKGVTKTTVTDGFVTALSPTVEVLYLKGAADGTCNGQKNAPLYQTAVYSKEGDAWKLAFMYETAAK